MNSPVIFRQLVHLLVIEGFYVLAGAGKVVEDPGGFVGILPEPLFALYAQVCLAVSHGCSGGHRCRYGWFCRFFPRRSERMVGSALDVKPLGNADILVGIGHGVDIISLSKRSALEYVA